MEVHLPEKLLPLLEQTVRGLRRTNVPADFWTIDHGPTILEGFSVLASLLLSSNVLEEEVPHGYVVLAYLFNWESECQFDGWDAFKNIGPTEFGRVLKYFSEVGLNAEAESLQVQMATYVRDPDDLEALNMAAGQATHALSGDLDRLEYLTQYLCDHAEELLYEQT